MLSEKTDKEHWDRAWVRRPRMRLPSGLFVGTRNIQRLLRRSVTPGIRFLEIGCAPGKILSWVAKVLGASVSGVDYSAIGIDHAKELFRTLAISGDLRSEDIYQTSFRNSTFDFVFSCGLIEHFEDPESIVEIHAKLLKPGGKAVIAVPNYGGVYGRLQKFFDPGNLTLHNLDIMQPSSLSALAPTHLVRDVRSYPFGRLTGTLVSFHQLLPGWLTQGLTLCLNVIGLLQPIDVRFLCPLLVLEMTRNNDKGSMEQ